MSEWWETLTDETPVATLPTQPVGGDNWWESLTDETPAPSQEAPPAAWETPIAAATDADIPQPEGGPALMPQAKLDQWGAEIDQLPLGPERDELAAQYAEAVQQNSQAGFDTRQGAERGLTYEQQLASQGDTFGAAWAEATPVIPKNLAIGVASVGKTVRNIGATLTGNRENADKVNRIWEFGQGLSTAGDRESFMAEHSAPLVAETVGQLSQFIGQAAASNAIAKPAGLGAKGAYALMAAMYGTSTADDSYTHGVDAGLSPVKATAYAGGMGAIEAGLMMLGGKLAAKFGLKTAEELLTPGIKRAAERTVGKYFRDTALGTIAESTEEGVTQIAQQLWGTALGADSTDKLTQNTLRAALLGAFGNVAASGIDAALTDWPTVVEATKAAESYEGEPPPNSRRGFEKATGQKNTSKVYREAFIDEVTLRQNASLNEAAEPITEEVPPPLPSLSSRVRNDGLRNLPDSEVGKLGEQQKFPAVQRRAQSEMRVRELSKSIADEKPAPDPIAAPKREPITPGGKYIGWSVDINKLDRATSPYPAFEQPMIPTGETRTRKQSFGGEVTEHKVTTGSGRQFWLEEDALQPDGIRPPTRKRPKEPLMYRGAEYTAPLTPEQIAHEAKREQYGGGALLMIGANPKVLNKVGDYSRKLANIAQTPRERDYLAELDKVATEAGEPGRRSDDTVDAEATERLTAGRDTERAKIVEAGTKGGQLNDVETVIAKQLFQDEAYEALQSGDEAKLIEAAAFRDAYRATGTEQARAFRQRHDPLNGKTVVEATPKQRQALLVDEIFERPAKERKEREKAVRNGDAETIKKLDQKFARRLQQIEKHLNSLGLTLDDLPALAKDPIETARVRNQISAANKTLADKLFEYRSSMGLFSGPATQVANIGGNAAHGLYDFAIQAPTEAVINEMLMRVGAGDPAGRRIGEFPHMWKGIQAGLTQGFKNALISWKTEMPVSVEGEKFDHPNVAIGGKLGRFVRAPGYRLLGAADEFFNTLFANIEVGGAAFRAGTLQGLSGQELEAFVHHQTTTPDSLAWRLALKHAGELTFHQELNGLGQKSLNAARTIRNIPGMRWFIPVISFPVKSAATALRKSPVTGDIAMMTAAYDNWKQGRPATFGMSKRFAERALAWGAMTAIAASIDDEEPWITGSSTNPQGTPKNSVNIGGQWFSYARVEPFATILGMTIDGINTVKTGSPDKIVSAPFDIVASQIASKTFLQGLSDLFTLAGITRESKNEAAADRAAKWSWRFGESFVPNFYRQTVGATRTSRDETRVWGQDTGSKIQMAGKRLAEGTLPIKYEAKIDPWGRPLPSGVAPFWSAPLTDFAWRLMSPVYQSPDNPTRGDKLIARWNSQHPDDQKSLSAPMPYFTQNGKRYSMTTEEYEAYQIESGKLADKLVSTIPGTDSPSEATMKRIEKLIGRARDLTRKRMSAGWRKARSPAVASPVQ